MKLRVECISCKKLFWAKAMKNKVTRKVEALDNVCQTCKNRIRQKENAKKSKKPFMIRVAPEKFEKQIKMRELYQAEMERRREEKKNEK